jgi:hypothetical protein
LGLVFDFSVLISKYHVAYGLLNVYVYSAFGRGGTMKRLILLGRSAFVATTGLIILMSSPLIASVGTEVFDFLRLPNGARCAALSGSRTGMMGDPFALFSNPAGLYTDTRAAGMTYTRFIAGIQGGCGTFVSPMFGGTLGAGISYLNFGEMDKTGRENQPMGTFSSQSFVPTAGFAKAFGSSVAGATAKLIYQSIDEYTGIATAGDIGYMFYPKGWPGLAIGGTIQNLGAQLTKFHEVFEPLPIFARVGGSYLALNKLLLISAELELAIPDSGDHPLKEFVLGIEWRPVRQLAIRGGYYSLGYDSEAESGLDILAGKSVGIGLDIQRFHLDYALTPMVDMGFVHRISLTRPLVATSDKSQEKPKPDKKLKQTPKAEKQTEEIIEKQDTKKEADNKEEPEEKGTEKQESEEKPEEEPEGNE